MATDTLHSSLSLSLSLFLLLGFVFRLMGWCLFLVDGGNTASNDGGEKKKGDGREKKEETPITVILKIDMHCEGCATKIVKCVKAFAEVETVMSESQANKLTVVGKVDPTTLRDKLAAKTNKKVDLVSAQPKMDNKDDGGDAKKKPSEKSNDDKKTKEPSVKTAILKLKLHCQGCIRKIHTIVTKTKGFNDMTIYREKELLMVKGSMDMKDLVERLKKKLKRSVDIVPQLTVKGSMNKKVLVGRVRL